MVNSLKNLYNNVKGKFKTRNIAFTLAETLIVMGIIGVVAALTIPNLNSSTNDAEKVAKVKKIYANLTEAYERATAVYGPYKTWFSEDGNNEGKRSLRMGERITEFMKVSKNCKYDKGCFSEQPLYYIDDSSAYDNYYESFKNYPAPMYLLADGTSVAFVAWRLGDFWNYFIYVDIDGSNKGKNKEGYDIFKFQILDINGSMQICPDGLWQRVEVGVEGEPFYIDYSYNYPSLWIIEYGNMDYTKCMDDLKWGTKTSCK